MSFQVPEKSRLHHDPQVGSDASDGNNGAFLVPSPAPGWVLLLICSDGGGWEHVSVSARRHDKTRIPTWQEMSFVKRTCWGADDVVVQFHPRERDYVNTHPHVLHLWRPIGVELPTPDPTLVGVPGVEVVP
jgi:hypothetical protein